MRVAKTNSRATNLETHALWTLGDQYTLVAINAGTGLTSRRNAGRPNLAISTVLTLHRPVQRLSKELEHLTASWRSHLAWYNFVRIHRTLRTALALAAGVTDRVWSLEELVA